MDTHVAAEVLDRLTAVEVAHRYVDRVDALDMEGLAQLFAEDASVDLLGASKAGVESITRHLGRALGAFEATSHHLTNPLVRIDGDGAQVSAGVYAWHRRRGGAWWHFWGRYDFELRREGDGWRVSHLRLTGIDGGPDGHPAERDLYTGHPDRPTVEQESA